MATTTKKTTKAKPKTTKTSTRSSKTTPPKTSTKKAAVKKAATPVKSKAASVVSSKKRTMKNNTAEKPTSFKLARVVTLRTLRGLHMISAGIFILLALAAGYFMNNQSYQLTIGHLAKDEIASQASTVLAPAVQAVYDVELRWAVVAILLLSAIMPVLYLTKLTGRYAAYLNGTRMLPMRWIDFAVTGALILETAALVSGTSDLPTLKLIAGIMIITAILGLIAERQNNNTKLIVRSAYFTSLITGLMPVLFIASYVVATVIFGTSNLPWHIFGLLAVTVFQYVFWMRNLRMHLRGANNLIVERNYLAIGLLTKAAFAIVLIAGLFR